MEKKSNLFEWLIPQSKETQEENDIKLNYRFAPISDTSLMKISWNSQDDNKPNLFNILLDKEPYTIKIKDEH